jgi:hypothetical protein
VEVGPQGMPLRTRLVLGLSVSLPCPPWGNLPPPGVPWPWHSASPQPHSNRTSWPGSQTSETWARGNLCSFNCFPQVFVTVTKTLPNTMPVRTLRSLCTLGIRVCKSLSVSKSYRNQISYFPKMWTTISTSHSTAARGTRSWFHRGHMAPGKFAPA